MNEDLGFLLVGVLAIGLLVGLRLLAGKFKFFRWYWNTSFKISSYIPFCGWMSRFIIADTEAEKTQKEHFVQTGAKVDNVAFGAVEQAAAREQQKIKEAQALQSAVCQRLGRSDVTVTSDGSSIKIGNGDWIPAENVKSQLGL